MSDPGGDDQPTTRSPPGRDRNDGRPRRRSDPPAPEHGAELDSAGGSDRPSGWWLFAHDVVSSVAAVAIVGGYLFMISGVWPPMVAVESPSMVPNIHTNDLVFVIDNDRFVGEGAVDDTGVVTAKSGEQTGYRTFGEHGDVIVFAPNGDESKTPIIHRAMFWVNESEDWTEKADADHLGGVDSCSELENCPAEFDGFITKGDGNGVYDQRRENFEGQDSFEPVKPEWIIGTAEVRIPGIGWIRLQS